MDLPKPEDITCSADEFADAEQHVHGLEIQRGPALRIAGAMMQLAEEFHMDPRFPGLRSRLLAVMSQEDRPEAYRQVAARVREILKDAVPVDYGNRLAEAVLIDFDNPHQARIIEEMRNLGAGFELIDCEVPRAKENHANVAMAILFHPDGEMEQYYGELAAASYVHLPRLPRTVVEATLARMGAQLPCVVRNWEGAD